MKRLFIFLSLLLIANSAFARSTPEQWLETKGKALIEALSDKNGINRFENTKKIAETSFHRNELSRLAMGRYWRDFSDEQRSVYRDLFLDYFLSVYTEDPLPVKDVKFQITDKRLTPKDVLLKVDVDALPSFTQKISNAQVQSEQMRLELIFALRERPDGFYIRDVQVEGKSMLLFVRQKIEELYARAGYDPLAFLNGIKRKINQSRYLRERAATNNSANSAG
ncbi:MAG TPA: hypothetical protein DD624_04725 [Alphaproteobacteria bacterium]|nr:hypothetical protein [Alphaproteobacteria bacterium]